MGILRFTETQKMFLPFAAPALDSFSGLIHNDLNE